MCLAHARSFISLSDWDCISINKSENKEVYVAALFAFYAYSVRVSQLISTVVFIYLLYARSLTLIDLSRLSC